MDHNNIDMLQDYKDFPGNRLSFLHRGQMPWGRARICSFTVRAARPMELKCQPNPVPVRKLVARNVEATVVSTLHRTRTMVP